MFEKDIDIVRSYNKDKRVIIPQTPAAKKWCLAKLKMDTSGKTCTVAFEGLEETVIEMKEAGLSIGEWS